MGAGDALPHGKISQTRAHSQCPSIGLHPLFHVPHQTWRYSIQHPVAPIAISAHRDLEGESAQALAPSLFAELLKP